jgi:hypothetical protein
VLSPQHAKSARAGDPGPGLIYSASPALVILLLYLDHLAPARRTSGAEARNVVVRYCSPEGLRHPVSLKGCATREPQGCPACEIVTRVLWIRLIKPKVNGDGQECPSHLVWGCYY